MNVSNYCHLKPHLNQAVWFSSGQSSTLGNGKVITVVCFQWQPYHYLISAVVSLCQPRRRPNQHSEVTVLSTNEQTAVSLSPSIYGMVQLWLEPQATSYYTGTVQFRVLRVQFSALHDGNTEKCVLYQNEPCCLVASGLDFHISVTPYKCSNESVQCLFAVLIIIILIFFSGLSFVNPSSRWGIALKSQQTATNMTASTAAQECRRTMKII